MQLVQMCSHLPAVTPEGFGMLGSLEAAPAALRARGDSSEHIFLWEIHSMSECCLVDGSQRYGAEACVGNKGKSTRKNGFNLQRNALISVSGHRTTYFISWDQLRLHGRTHLILPGVITVTILNSEPDTAS